jgi:hypothetical protein
MTICVPRITLLYFNRVQLYNDNMLVLLKFMFNKILNNLLNITHIYNMFLLFFLKKSYTRYIIFKNLGLLV